MFKTNYTDKIFYLASVSIISILAPFGVGAEVLYLDPAAGRVSPGDTFSVSVKIDPQGECVNAGQITVAYPAQMLKVVDFGTGGSIFSIWTEIPDQIDIDNANRDGLITFSGGIPAGYCGNINSGASEANLLGKIIFKVPEFNVGGSTTDAAAAISISETSQLYANDGEGTLLPFAARGADFTLSAAVQKPQNTWQAEIRRDTTPPEQFSIEIGKDDSTFDGKYFIMFSAIDLQTGIDHYEISESPRDALKNPGPESWKKGISPYVLEDQTVSSIIKVKAVDKAGNATLAVYRPEPARKIFPIREQLLFLLAFAAICILMGKMVYRFIVRKHAHR